MSNPREMYTMIQKDDIGEMLLERKDITDAEGLETFIFRS